MRPSRPSKLIASLAATACAFAVCNAHATVASFTNSLTISVTTTEQGASTVATNKTTYAAPKTSTLTTASLISELGLATSNSFTSAAKLVMIGGSAAVIDGSKVVDVSSFLQIGNPGNNRILSGTESTSGLAFPTLKTTQLISVSFDDTSVRSNGLSFDLTGLATSTMTDTVPSTNGVYNETFSAKVLDMTGEGTNKTVPFVATGTASASGKGERAAD